MPGSRVLSIGRSLVPHCCTGAAEETVVLRCGLLRRAAVGLRSRRASLLSLFPAPPAAAGRRPRSGADEPARQAAERAPVAPHHARGAARCGAGRAPAAVAGSMRARHDDVHGAFMLGPAGDGSSRAAMPRPRRGGATTSEPSSPRAVGMFARICTRTDHARADCGRPTDGSVARSRPFGFRRSCSPQRSEWLPGPLRPRAAGRSARAQPLAPDRCRVHRMHSAPMSRAQARRIR